MPAPSPSDDDMRNLKLGSGRSVRVVVDGPYGGSMFTDFAEYQSVLLLAGGSGISFAAPIFEELIARSADLRGSIRTRHLTLVWWVIRLLRHAFSVLTQDDSSRSMKALENLDWYQEMS
mgnify:CR=1 FL=1